MYKRQVTVTAVENADVQNMMDQGNIDAALVPEPWGSTLVKNGAEIVLDYNQVYMEGNYPVAVVVVRNEFLKEHPDLVKEFLRQHEEATDEINQNVEMCIRDSYMRESSSYQLHYTDSVDKKLFKYVNDFIKNDMNIKKAINQK